MRSTRWSLGLGAAMLLLAPAAAVAQVAETHGPPGEAGLDLGSVEAEAAVGELGEWNREYAQWEAGREQWGREAEEYQEDVADWEGEMAEYRRSYGIGLTGTSGGMMPPVAAAVYVPYVQVTVSAGSAGFYYVRQNYFLNLSGTTYAEKVAAVASQPAYGPHPDGKKVQLAPGYNYFFFPLCAGALDWEKKAYQSFAYDDESTTVTLSCGAP
jgi:hypothetical protein